MLRFDDAERAKKMCQDEWLNASVIPLQIALDHLQSEVFAWWVYHNICERTNFSYTFAHGFPPSRHDRGADS